MQRKPKVLLVLCITAIIVWLATPCEVLGQQRDATKKGTQTRRISNRQRDAGESNTTQTRARETTLSGRIVDLHSFFTKDYGTEDQAKVVADRIRAGVPAVLELRRGIVLLSQGAKGAEELVVPFSHKQVEVKGRVYGSGRLKYMEITSIKGSDEKQSKAKGVQRQTRREGVRTKDSGQR